MNVVLVGDSIFDNASYVNSGESVSEQLSRTLKEEVTLLAVDGDVTTNVAEQLKSYPRNGTHTFVSCGGNDALRASSVLEKQVSSVAESLTLLHEVTESFRGNYSKMLDAIAEVGGNVSLCTIYNNVPGVSDEALKALALFNEVILEEGVKRNLALIDLRIICNEEDDYSAVSPIEPSAKGGRKIVSVLARVLAEHDYSSLHARVYT